MEIGPLGWFLSRVDFFWKANKYGMKLNTAKGQTANVYDSGNNEWSTFFKETKQV